jgi:hypothetical protein
MPCAWSKFTRTRPMSTTHPILQHTRADPAPDLPCSHPKLTSSAEQIASNNPTLSRSRGLEQCTAWSQGVASPTPQHWCLLCSNPEPYHTTQTAEPWAKCLVPACTLRCPCHPVTGASALPASPLLVPPYTCAAPVGAVPPPAAAASAAAVAACAPLRISRMIPCSSGRALRAQASCR